MGQFSFIVCIRNSHSKLFAANAKDQVGDGKNVPAGTAVTGFGASPDSFHFHLCSHAGVGTVNPTFYQVLHDDNELELDNLVKMTYALTMGILNAVNEAFLSPDLLVLLNY